MSDRNIAWFGCPSGIAGDMALGALIDAGAPVDEIRSMLARLAVPGWTLAAERVLRAGMSATRAKVDCRHEHAHRGLSDIVGIIRAGELPDRVEGRAIAVFTKLAEVEARLHGVSVDEVHFHEVGALDAIVDIVGVCCALEILGIDDIGCSRIAVGTGTVRAAHGVLPNPAPAVPRLLEGFAVVAVDETLELTTPTGAALMAALCNLRGPMPEITISSSGYGAGGRELSGRPNCTQVVIGTRSDAHWKDNAGQPVVVLETNVDDLTGEVLAHTIDRLIGAGALDAWVTPIVMKKGRPAHTVHVLSSPADRDRLSRLLRDETGTLGVRSTDSQRWMAERSFSTVTIEGHAIAIKHSAGTAKAEFEDVRAAAAALGRPLRLVRDEAERLAADQRFDPPAAGSR
ncbi:MAG: nickel pincer cofactor biosynthesis protein LarC [Acidimicrobiia bacterium]